MRLAATRQHLVGEAGPVGGHVVVRGDRPQGHDVAVGAVVPLHAGAAGVGQHGEDLPQAAVEAGRLDLLDEDGVRLAQHGQALVGDLAQHAHGEAGAGEGVAPDDLFREPQLRPHRPRLVLEEVAQGLDQAEGQVLGQAPHVVVGLDLRRRPGLGGGALDHVRVQRPLGQEGERPLLRRQGPRLALEDADEALPHHHPLLLRLDHPAEVLQELVAGVHVAQAEPQVLPEGAHHGWPLVLAQQPVVHEDAGQLVADGAGGSGRRRPRSPRPRRRRTGRAPAPPGPGCAPPPRR